MLYKWVYCAFYCPPLFIFLSRVFEGTCYVHCYGFYLTRFKVKCRHHLLAFPDSLIDFFRNIILPKLRIGEVFRMPKQRFRGRSFPVTHYTMTELAFVFVDRFPFLVIVRFGTLGNDMLTIQCHKKNTTDN